VTRAQTSWVLAVVSLTALTMLADLATRDRFDWAFSAVGAIETIVFLLVPLAMGIAIVRYRLFDIERIISRAISYTLITAILAATFGGAVIGLGGLIGSTGRADTIAVATLLVAAMFAPLRRRAQATVDRRFDRSRYDAAHTLDGLAARLRVETDIDRVGADLLAVVDTTVHPVTRSLWMRSVRPRERPG
jgi:hypothetical protein